MFKHPALNGRAIDELERENAALRSRVATSENARADNEHLRAKIDAALQRLNESDTGVMGLLDTIHAVHAILKSE